MGAKLEESYKKYQVRVRGRTLRYALRARKNLCTLARILSHATELGNIFTPTHPRPPGNCNRDNHMHATLKYCWPCKKGIEPMTFMVCVLRMCSCMCVCVRVYGLHVSVSLGYVASICVQSECSHWFVCLVTPKIDYTRRIGSPSRRNSQDRDD